MVMEGFMARENPRSIVTEAYRKIAINIEAANADGNIKTIMITSSVSGEGKTTSICNIAEVMIDLNKRVLLLDMDFRKPSLHEYFKLSNKTGITDILINKDDFRGYINNVYENLDVVTIGKIPSNPSEMLNSEFIRELISEMSESYDYIFIDTSPVALVSDPITIATFADGVLFVVAHSETDSYIARKSVESLKRVNANIIGTIFNKIPATKTKLVHKK